MQNHEHFEELCALAAVGELAVAEQVELKNHLGECSVCRETVQDMAAVTDIWIPATSPISDAMRPLLLRSTGRLRERFVATARERGINLTRQSDKRASLWMEWPLHMGKPFVATAALVAAVVTFGLVLTHIERRNTNLAGEVVSLRAELADLKRENASLNDKEYVEEQYRKENQSSNALNERELTELKEERDNAATRANATEREAALHAKDRDQLLQELSNSRADLERISENYAAANRDLAAVTTELASARASSAEDRALLAAQEKKIQELSQRPAIENTDLERERQLLAADRDIRDLMGARNLHIIDVHDRDYKGKARRSFGRVFYTEGKSLIFYAFDLSDPKLKDASFQAWGHKEDGSRKAISLGLFYMDDKQQSRWVLRFNDPAVLAEIDSVFVTVARPGGGKDPSGEKLLYAFLNFDANHP